MPEISTQQAPLASTSPPTSALQLNARIPILDIAGEADTTAILAVRVVSLVRGNLALAIAL